MGTRFLCMAGIQRGAAAPVCDPQGLYTRKLPAGLHQQELISQFHLIQQQPNVSAAEPVPELRLPAQLSEDGLRKDGAAL